MKMKVGFIGMGIMGQPMSRNVLKAGYDMMVYNRTVQKTEPLISAGALPAKNPKQVAEWADILILMLTDPAAIDAVLEGDSGILAGAGPGKTLINMSTVSPAYTEHLNERLKAVGIALVDAPVSGSREPAAEGTLVILAGGVKEKIAQMEPLLLTMGKKIIYCGGVGKGSAMKMTLNLLLGIMMEGLGEAINLGEQCGLSLETLLDTILNSLLGCDLFGFKADMFRTSAFTTQFPLKHMAKDLALVLETSKDTGAAAPLGSMVFRLYQDAMEQNLGEMDFAAIKKVLEKMSTR